ncbi:MAG: relaxase/mobilization nuclease domain-containing protein [Cyanobacteria bacterium P01_F01_bin.143]
MKAKITKGKNFKTIINYVFSPGEKNKKDRADWIGGTLSSDNAQGLIKDFDTVQRLRPHIEKPSWHCSLTLPEGEYLSDGEWEDIVSDFMEKMEFSKLTPYTIVRHNDTEFDHVHVIASRVPMTGPVWTGRNDVYRAIAATQELEKEYNLTQTPGYKKRESARETYRERKKAERTGVTPPRIQLQELIDSAVVDKPTAPQFAQRLEDKGVIVRANLASTGKMNGFSFELDGLAFKGSSLGKAYSWSGLQKRGITYEPDTDAAGLERYKLPVAERPPHTDETVPSVSRSTQTVEPSPELEEDTDSIEAARLEAAINAVSEIFNQSINQGKSRALSEEFSSESSLKIEDSAQQNSTEATPEATQPAVEPNALSQALPTEATPEIPPTPAVPSALYEALPQEVGQQQQWVESLCPKLVGLLNSEGEVEVKGRRRTIAWDEQQQRLTVRKNKSQEVVLEAEWDEDEERWKDNGSSLTADDFEDISRGLEKWLVERERERERQQQRSNGGFELG